jgi:hypothetical protein
MKTPAFAKFFEAFLKAALYSSTGVDDQPLDKKFKPEDIDKDSLEVLRAHALSFYSRMWYYVAHEVTLSDGYTKAGHDFWMTSQAHGCGFWDGDWPVYGEQLTQLSKCYPPLNFVEVGNKLSIQ